MRNVLQNHAQLKQYLHIIQDSPVFPIVQDSNGIILSLPPIINGNHSKITLSTKNVFIECTATDLTKVYKSSVFFFFYNGLIEFKAKLTRSFHLQIYRQE